MAKFRMCEDCGAALDPGERCDCKKDAGAQSVVYKAREAAIKEALDAEVSITLEKKKGSESFRREIRASSAPAALNGLAVLLKEYAKTVGVSTVQVLAILATVLTVPEMRDGDAGEEK